MNSNSESPNLEIRVSKFGFQCPRPMTNTNSLYVQTWCWFWWMWNTLYMLVKLCGHLTTTHIWTFPKLSVFPLNKCVGCLCIPQNILGIKWLHARIPHQDTSAWPHTCACDNITITSHNHSPKSNRTRS